MGSLPRIRYLAMGGTISSLQVPGGAGVTPSLRSAELLTDLPVLGEIAEVEPVDFPTVASYDVTPTAMLELARAVARAAAEGCAGVVVTHGTDTIEETAYALALMVDRRIGVALAGAMRNPAMLAAEGALNLVNAFRVAASPAAREVGPVVVLDDEIHAARFATKAHTSRASAFVSFAGQLGEVTERRVDLWYRPAWDDYLGLPTSVADVSVPVVWVDPTGSGGLLHAAADLEPAGIVIAGTGGGHVPTAMLDQLDAVVARGLPVVVASRLVGGTTLESTYAMPGAELDLVRRGALLAGRLSPQKARLRLLVGRALGLDPHTLFPVR